ncbi:ATP/GTP-binding protein [Streptomyces sp. NPDC053705]|uniref:ATP/GTP-binding protein n=1 Tax=unclassified Streptomyces TaxID=2593676 RepID=UPI000BE27174
MLSRTATTAATAVVLAVVLVPAAHADGPGGGVCGTGDVLVTVCAEDGGGSSGSGPAGVDPVSTGSSTKPADKCSYAIVDDPPPPAGHQSWGRRGSDEGAVYKVQCDSGRGGVVFVPTGQAGPGAPTIDPETVARKAAASMRLDGPKVVSPRAAGTYVVGMPMWMWAEPSSSTFGPVSASATAGGVTVTATAKVTRVRWAMGDGASVTCHGPGTPYRKSREVTESPDCGHLYERPSYEEPGGRYRGTVTAAWTITWSAPRPGRRRDVHRDPADAVHGRCPRGPGRQHPLTCPGAFPR